MPGTTGTSGVPYMPGNNHKVEILLAGLLTLRLEAQAPAPRPSRLGHHGQDRCAESGHRVDALRMREAAEVLLHLWPLREGAVLGGEGEAGELVELLWYLQAEVGIVLAPNAADVVRLLEEHALDACKRQLLGHLHARHARAEHTDPTHVREVAEALADLAAAAGRH